MVLFVGDSTDDDEKRIYRLLGPVRKSPPADKKEYEKRRTNGRAVGEAVAAEARSWSSSTRSSPDPQWHSVDCANRSTVEGPAGAIWAMEHCRQPILSVGQGRGVAKGSGSAATAGRCRR